MYFDIRVFCENLRVDQVVKAPWCTAEYPGYYEAKIVGIQVDGRVDLDFADGAYWDCVPRELIRSNMIIKPGYLSSDHTLLEKYFDSLPAADQTDKIKLESHFGKVVDIWTDDDGRTQYRIEYRDGDIEDLDLDEIRTQCALIEFIIPETPFGISGSDYRRRLFSL